MPRSIPDYAIPLVRFPIWHVFDPRAACVAGVPGAIVLERIRALLSTEARKEVGEHWIVLADEELRSSFPYWSVATTERTIRKLIKQRFLREYPAQPPRLVTIRFDVLDAAYIAFVAKHTAP